MLNTSELEVIFHSALNQFVDNAMTNLSERESKSVVIVFAPIIINMTADATNAATIVKSKLVETPATKECENTQELRKIWGLTKREAQSIELLAAGYSNKDIAKQLSIGLQPVCNYLSTAYRKMGVNSALGAVLVWQQNQQEVV